MKKKHEFHVPSPNVGPVTVAIPNTSEKKMEAIATLARAMETLAKAIDGVNTNVTVMGCTITGVGSGTAINIGKA